jgi:hypothetical protein
MLEPQDIAALRETAERATPGPWELDDFEVIRAGYGSPADGELVVGEDCGGGGGILSSADVRFVAAASPDVVLALLSEVERGRALRAAVEALAERGELEIASLIRSAALIQPFGPNSRAVHDAGGAVHLTPAEAEAGARAVLDHLATLIAAHVPSPLLDGGAGEGDR